ncbi:hypothetical protein GCM10008107_24080 [Psychrosphaera saromensis]|uniref:Uncharacterized protein n=1 Tax=Psychrosphaera saromensis TaxID=716813 RepID=A0A2S7UT45_9GAMM|nr:hypothetical protein [Psychrosphaera saromensis]PQJ52440.1 hypothetical protein BTO11_01405 [Psychrosphaera saromensis]GHB73757.1 hypothetical protein GCM10008107_24080 [Psychrosphaera saromensis]GLQ13389.1 hypothetical protein GCM10007917_08440 [Psychrosphaera saromensis]
MNQKKLIYSIFLIFILSLTLFYFYSIAINKPLKTNLDSETSTLALVNLDGEKLNEAYLEEKKVIISQNTPKPISNTNKKRNSDHEQELLQQEKIYPTNQQIIEFQKEFDRKNDEAYGYFMKIRDFAEAFESDEYDSEWSSRMINDINDTILFDIENGSNRFSAIAVDELECRGTLCKIDFQNVSDDLADWETQKRELRNALMRLGSTNNEGTRAIKTHWLDNGKIRYYISKGIND